MNDLMQASFDYAALPVEIATKAQIAASNIKLRLKRTVEDIIEIGRELTAVKAELPHGQFLPWIAAEFEMSEDTAQNFLRVYERFGQIPNNSVFSLKPTILYALSAPSTPDSIIDKAIEKAESGAKVTIADVRDWKAELETEKQRSEEFRQESNERRKTIRTLEEQIDLLTTRDRAMQDRLEQAEDEIQRLDKLEPEKIVVHPEDYETSKARLAELEAELVRVKKEQARLVNDQLKAKLNERARELEEIEQRKTIMEEQVERMKNYLASLDRESRRLEVHQKVIEELRLKLLSLAVFLSDEEPVQDADTRKCWHALADMLAEAMTAVRQYSGDHRPELTVIRGDAA